MLYLKKENKERWDFMPEPLKKKPAMSNKEKEAEITRQMMKATN